MSREKLFEDSIIVTYLCEKEEAKKLSVVSAYLGISKSTFIRAAVLKALAEYEESLILKEITQPS